MSLVYRKKYEINYYDVDYKLNCKLPSLANFFCDIGNNQSESLGDTIEVLTEKNMAWVFYQYDIKVYEYPRYREVVNIETKATGFKKFYANRGYRVINEDGKLLAEATALFFLIDIEKRKPMRISDEQVDLYGAQDVAGIKVDMDKLLKLEREDVKVKFNIRYSDIDSNGHVNNSKYMEWAIESMPRDIIEKYKLDRIKVVFEKETYYGHEIEVITQIDHNDDNSIKTVHLIKSEDGLELTKLEMDWSRE